MPHLAIIADDLTGAADSSACFADAGYATVIPLFGTAAPPADVIAVSTESRDLPATEAARVTEETITAQRRGAVDAEPPWIYKKIDSAMRGHPRDEVLAAMEAAGIQRAIVAPALPAEGRTTISGCQHVGGVPLADSHLGGPHVDSDLRRIFANDQDIPVRYLDLETTRNRPAGVHALLADPSPGIVIADAETDADLAMLAAAASACGQRILSGSAGFARQLAPVLRLTATAPRPVAIQRGGGPILAVVGSQHVATKRQIDALAGAGVPVVRLSQTMIDDPASSLATVVAEVTEHLARACSVAVTTSGLAPSSSRERSVASRLAEVAAAPEIVSHLGGMVLTGGDVAAAVCASLGASAIWLGGEIYAGQPWGMLEGGAIPGLPIATKAGSFGQDDALLLCMEHLQRLEKG